MGRVCHDFGLLCGNSSLSCLSTLFANSLVFIGFHLLLSGNQLSQFISGAILYDETIRQSSQAGLPFTQVMQDARTWSKSTLTEWVTTAGFQKVRTAKQQQLILFMSAEKP
ncbi:MAG: fructose-bisphosphate aldolase class I [Cyanobacteria bacterium CRU_2_1]|nr:fructose-bisphosphate aldolase class I [Cyanobacteria bacterium CRU_2_1]